MRSVRIVKGRCLAAALIVGLLASQGCTSLAQRAKSPCDYVTLYVKDRIDDLLEGVEVGITVSSKPGFALYGHPVSLAPTGYSNVDGHFLGIGAGQFLGLSASGFEIPRHYFAAYGLVAWGYEEMGWSDYDPNNVETLQCLDLGVPGLLLPPYGRPGPWPT
jgi:hypothetical protein